MASRGNNSGGGCLSIIIAFFIMFFLPFILFGEEKGADILYIWVIVIGILGGVSAIAIDSYENTHKKNQTDRVSKAVTTANPSHSPNTQIILNVTEEHINKDIFENYKDKKNLKTKLEQEVDELDEKRISLERHLSVLVEERDKLLNEVGKPFFVSKRAFVEKQQPEIGRKTVEIEETNTLLDGIAQQIDEKKESITKIHFCLLEDRNPAFDTLKMAFEQWKKSDNISGGVNIKNSLISSSQRDSDLELVQYLTQPYGLLLSNYRFYFFPKSIWVFEDERRLVGIYNPKALNCLYQTYEKTDYGRGEKIFSDTTIIRRRYTWLHTRIDGSPDRRYKYNPMSIYTTYKECEFNLLLCGCKIKFYVSSEKNCADLNKAILSFSEVK